MPGSRRARSLGRRLCRTALSCVGLFVLLFVGLLLGPGSSANDRHAGASETTQITPGTVINREASPARNDVFTISLTRGQLLRLSVTKADLALKIVLFDPTGAKLLEQINRDYETVEFSYPANIEGIYRVVFESLETSQIARRYELEIKPSLPVTAEKGKDSEARQAMAAAAALRTQWIEASLRQAIDKYDDAASTWIGIKDLSDAARATEKSGEVCFVLSEYREALKRYQRTFQLATRAGDQLVAGRALSQIGLLYSYLGNNDLAQSHLTKACGFFESDQSRQSPEVHQAFGVVLSNLAEVSYSKGDFVNSLAQLKRARKIFNEIGDRNGAARVSLFTGYISGSLGEPGRATEEISRARDLYREIKNRVGEGLATTALGLFHSLKRDEDTAIKLHREAIETFRVVGDRHSEAIALNALGQSYEHLSEYSIALDNYQKALGLFHESSAQDLISVTLFKIARFFRMRGDLDRAEAYYERCLTLSRAARKARTQVQALEEVASIFAAQGRRAETLSQYAKIQRFYRSIGDLPGQANSWNVTGDFLRKAGKNPEALIAYQKALPLSEKSGDNGILITSLFNLALVSRDIGALDQALSYIQRALNLIEELRTNVGSMDFRASYFSGVRKHYELCIDILMRLHKERPGKGFDANALVTSETARARSLLDLLNEARKTTDPKVSPELLNRERELRGLIRSQAQYAMELAMNKNDSTEVAEVAAQMDQLRSEYAELQVQLRDESHQPLTLTKPLDLEQIQNQLRDGHTILLEYALGEERSYLWAVTSEAQFSYELPGRKIIESAAAELYALIVARQEFDSKGDKNYQHDVETADKLLSQKARELSNLLLGDVADQLGTRRLVVVTEGALQYIPFDALPLPGDSSLASDYSLDSLITNHEIVALPSISTLIAIRAEKRSPPSGDYLVAVLADPVFSSTDDRVVSESSSVPVTYSQPADPKPGLRGIDGLPGERPARLIHASEEADAILSVAPRGSGLVVRGFDASRETAMNSLVGKYQILHFATHSIFNSKRPEFSGIVLSMVDSNGTAKNGLLLLPDIYGLNLSAELTVLSACETALGKDIKGEGLVGLTHSFLSAGSKSVVASLWKVDDRATASLMTDFYRSMLQEGMSPAAALRAAKLKVRQEQRWNHPYYWAGFVVQGEYTNRIIVHNNSSPRAGLLFGGILTLFFSYLFFLHRRRHRTSSRSHP